MGGRSGTTTSRGPSLNRQCLASPFVATANEAVAATTWDKPIAEEAEKWIEGWEGEEGFAEDLDAF